jgi:hypothetical protein
MPAVPECRTSTKCSNLQSASNKPSTTYTKSAVKVSTQQHPRCMYYFQCRCLNASLVPRCGCLSASVQVPQCLGAGASVPRCRGLSAYSVHTQCLSAVASVRVASVPRCLSASVRVPQCQKKQCHKTPQCSRSNAVRTADLKDHTKWNQHTDSQSAVVHKFVLPALSISITVHSCQHVDERELSRPAVR